SQREGENENTFQLPGYTIVNLMAGYQWKAGPSRVTVQFNIENLLDKDYFYSSTGDRIGGAHFGAPRTFLGSVGLEF
ncbi:MAG: TonB-dependent receptor domain-containing protein, partial [Gammaproteobacteria bacterium]